MDLSLKNIKDPYFRSAAAAVDSGNADRLQELLDRKPKLAGARLPFPSEGYFKFPYLLWFVANNPVRNERLPGNIVDIAALIIRYVSEHAGETYQYQLDYGLGLVSTSHALQRAGFQIPMMDVFIDAGAKPGNGLGALAHGCSEAAQHLVERGGTATLAASICINDGNKVREMMPSSTSDDKQIALMAAAFYGLPEMIKLLIDHGADANRIVQSDFHSHASPLHQAVASGSLDAVKLLLEAGAKPDAVDTIFHGTAAGWAKHLLAQQSDPAKRNDFMAMLAFLEEQQR